MRFCFEKLCVKKNRLEHQEWLDISNEINLNTADDKDEKKNKKKRQSAIDYMPSAKRKAIHEDDGNYVIVLTERIDVEAAKFLFAHLESIPTVSERSKFVRYARPLIAGNGEHQVHYKPPACGYGRPVPAEVCLQGIDRRVRSPLARNLYWDIDASNAHPVVLHAIAYENGWDCDCLYYYIKNREAVLSSIPLPRWLAKRVMLVKLYSGGVQSLLEKMIEDGEITGTVNEYLRHIPPFVYEYGEEVSEMSRKVAGVYPELAKAAADSAVKPDANINARVLSILAQTRETEVVMAAMEFMEFRGWQVGVLVHDGFMVYKRADAVINQALLNGIKMKVKEKCHLAIDFEVKEFAQPYGI